MGVACNRPSLLGDAVDLEIAPLVGPEIISGSTRLKGGTATKMVLNMISTGTMVRIGKTLGNWMVDLHPSNEKLRIRSRRILRDLVGVDDDRAAQILAACGGHLKRCARSGTDRHQSRRCRSSFGCAPWPGAGGGHGRRWKRSAMTGSESQSAVQLLGVDGGGTATEAGWPRPEGKCLVGEPRDRRTPRPLDRKQPAGQSINRSRPRFSVRGSMAPLLMWFASAWPVSTDPTIGSSSPAGPTKHGGVGDW